MESLAAMAQYGWNVLCGGHSKDVYVRRREFVTPTRANVTQFASVQSVGVDGPCHVLVTQVVQDATSHGPEMLGAVQTLHSAYMRSADDGIRFATAFQFEHPPPGSIAARYKASYRFALEQCSDAAWHHEDAVAAAGMP